MKKTIFIVSLALNLFSFTRSTDSQIINTLEDLSEWLEQDIEAALDHGDKALADNLAQYKFHIDDLVAECFDDSEREVHQPEYNHHVTTEQTRVVRDNQGNVISVWVDGHLYTANHELENEI